ncbi:MAG: hypothetical protein U1G07_19915 [Verrucomicrobiota bacterium]
MKTRHFLLAAWMIGTAGLSFAQATKPLYTNDFSHVALDTIPDDMLVLDGAFAVKDEQGNKVLQLPGAPLDSYGILFGPTEKDGVSVSARILSTAKGRRFPTFALGLNGVAGYRLQVSPSKKLIELYRGDALKTSASFEWQPATWTRLRLQVRKTAQGWTVEGRAWMEGEPEPPAWMISAEDREELPPGRAGVFGSPFSGTPISYDDLAVTKLPN